MKIKLFLINFILVTTAFGQSFELQDSDKVFTCAHIVNNITGNIDAFPCSMLKMIVKRDKTSEFIILNNENKEIHYKTKESFFIDNIKYYKTLSDDGVKTIFSITEEGDGAMRHMDVSFYSEMTQKPYSYKMRVFNYSVYDSKEIERVNDIKSKTYDLKTIDEKKWNKMLYSLHYSFSRYFKSEYQPKFDEKEKTKDFIFINNVYQIKATGDYRRDNIETKINLLQGEELPSLRSYVFIDEIPYVTLENGVGVYPEVNFPNIPVQYVQGVTILKIKWSNDIVEIIKRPPPQGLDIEKKLIDKIKKDHQNGNSLPIGNISIKYTYNNILGFSEIDYKWIKL